MTTARAGNRADDLAGALADATARLAGAGVASPRADAELLAAHVLGLTRSRVALAAATGAPLAAADRDRLRAAVARRAAREPLQHVVGSVGFRHLELAVGPGVFVPRPETEAVAGWAVDALRAAAPERRLCLDLCTGSGAIALALADEVPGAVVHAVEVDADALGWARRNIEATGLGVALHQADVRALAAGSEPAAALAPLAGRVDLVVANPPYLHDGDRGTLSPEVDAFDPPLALWGGPDGLDGVRAVAGAAGWLLRPGGVLVVEHDDADGVAAPGLLAALGGWTDVADHPDLAGRARFVTARKETW